MKRLVYLSPVPWNSFAQRPHKFVEWFHATTKGDVLWVEPYPTRFPRLSDLRRLMAKRSLENDHNPQWLKVLRPLTLPLEPLPGSGFLNRIFWHSILKNIELFIEEAPTLLAVGKPSVLALRVLEQFPNTVSLYDAMDNFPSFYSGISSLAMAWREQELVKRVTYLLVTSTALKRHWDKVRPDVKLVHNGLDPNVIPPPIDRQVLNRRILGYVGTIGPWFDWDWIIALAKVRHQDRIKLMGPLLTKLPYFLPGNIEILPPCTHQTALKVMQSFDVGLIPFKENHLTTSVDPIKYYEYRAIGLPVISTNFGEMAFRKREDSIFIYEKDQDINELVEKALQFKKKKEQIEQFIVQNTWETRFVAANLI